MAGISYLQISSYDLMFYEIRAQEKCIYKVESDYLGQGATGSVHICHDVENNIDTLANTPRFEMYDSASRGGSAGNSSNSSSRSNSSISSSSDSKSDSSDNSGSNRAVHDGDLFDYPPWGGLCTARWVGSDLWITRDPDNTNGTRVFQTLNGQGASLVRGECTVVRWDNRKNLKACMPDAFTIRVWHDGTPYDFTRVSLTSKHAIKIFQVEGFKNNLPNGKSLGKIVASIGAKNPYVIVKRGESWLPHIPLSESNGRFRYIFFYIVQVFLHYFFIFVFYLI